MARSWYARGARRASAERPGRGVPEAELAAAAGPVARRRFLLFASCNDTRLLVSSVPCLLNAIFNVRREIARDRLNRAEADCDRPIVPMPGWASLTLLNAALASMEVGFCDDNGDGFYMQQPANHLERWQLPRDNGTHLLIQWKIDRRMANRNVSSYMADVKTSVPVLNLFVGTFGGFPQDICAAEGSKARNAVKTHEAVRHPTCSPYAWDAASVQRSTSFEIPDALRLMASWDVSVVVRAYGSHAPIGQPEAAVPCVWWCHTYRRRREVDMKPSGAAGARGRRRLPRWMHNVWRILRRSAVDKGREL